MRTHTLQKLEGDIGTESSFLSEQLRREIEKVEGKVHTAQCRLGLCNYRTLAKSGQRRPA